MSHRCELYTNFTNRKSDWLFLVKVIHLPWRKYFNLLGHKLKTPEDYYIGLRTNTKVIWTLQLHLKFEGVGYMIPLFNYMMFNIYFSIEYVTLTHTWYTKNLPINRESIYICMFNLTRKLFSYTRSSTTIIRNTFNTRSWSPLIKPCAQIPYTSNNEGSRKARPMIILDKEQPLKRFGDEIFT